MMGQGGWKRIAGERLGSRTSYISISLSIFIHLSIYLSIDLPIISTERRGGFSGQPYQPSKEDSYYTGSWPLSAADLHRRLAPIEASHSIDCRPVNPSPCGLRGPAADPARRQRRGPKRGERERGPRGKRGHDPAGPTGKSAAGAGGPRGRRGRALTRALCGAAISQGISHNDFTGGR
jgi:hypothetical protein